MKLLDIIYEEEYIFSEADENIEIENIVTAPENATEHTLLIIPNSSKLSGDLILSSLPLAIACDTTEHLPKNVPHILLKDARKSVALAFYRFFEIDKTTFKTIAVTGTNGKTSTAAFIKTVLREQGLRTGYIGTGLIESAGRALTETNYSMTTPDAELLYSSLRTMEDDGCDAVVMEVSSHALALEKVAPLFFDYAVFTNLSSEHSDFHKTMDDYFDAKCKLFKKCRVGVFNIDDPYAKKAISRSSAEKNITAGVLNRGNIYATHIENSTKDGIEYLYHGENFLFKMKLSIPGIYNIYNSMLAAAVCIDMGISPCETKKAIEKLHTIPGRFEMIKDDVTVIIDFAHTEVAFESFLREAKSMARTSRLWVVFGCGGERDLQKRPKMAVVAEKYADMITVTSDNPRNEDPQVIISDICRGFSRSKHKVILNRSDAIKDSILSADTGDVIAVIGKGAEKYMIDKDGYHDFNEKEIIHRALELRKESSICGSN